MFSPSTNSSWQPASLETVAAERFPLMAGTLVASGETRASDDGYGLTGDMSGSYRTECSGYMVAVE